MRIQKRDGSSFSKIIYLSMHIWILRCETVRDKHGRYLNFLNSENYAK